MENVLGQNNQEIELSKLNKEQKGGKSVYPVSNRETYSTQMTLFSEINQERSRKFIQYNSTQKRKKELEKQQPAKSEDKYAFIMRGFISAKRFSSGKCEYWDLFTDI